VLVLRQRTDVAGKDQENGERRVVAFSCLLANHTSYYYTEAPQPLIARARKKGGSHVVHGTVALMFCTFALPIDSGERDIMNSPDAYLRLVQRFGRATSAAPREHISWYIHTTVPQTLIVVAISLEHHKATKWNAGNSSASFKLSAMRERPARRRAP
jgi:hypothetical protein